MARGRRTEVARSCDLSGSSPSSLTPLIGFEPPTTPIMVMAKDRDLEKGCETPESPRVGGSVGKSLYEFFFAK